MANSPPTAITFRSLVMCSAAFGAALWLLVACSSAATDGDLVQAAEPAEVAVTSEDVATNEPAPTTQTEPAAEAQPVPTSSPEPARPAPVEPVEPGSSSDEPEIVAVTYDSDFGTSIAPIFAEHCASCHNAGGPGAAHWTLENASDLVATHEWIAQVVDAQVMPPWPASELSAAFLENRALRADEIEAIKAWSASGASLDVDDTTLIAAPRGIVELAADIEIAPHETYVGSTDVVDDYRCLIYDLGLTEPAWMQGFEFVPDQEEIVHHAVGVVAPAWSMEQALELSAADEQAGWQCYGSTGLAQTSGIFLGWAPGQLPTQYPEGSGVLVEPGTFLVIQIHYHFDDQAAPDASSIRIDWADPNDQANLDQITITEFSGPAEIPCSTSESGPLCDRDAAMQRAVGLYGAGGVLADRINAICGVSPADFAEMTDGISSSSCDLPVRSRGEIVSVFGHLHEIGSAFRMTLNPGEPDEQILLDVPDWSFDWQHNYYLAESVEVEPTDRVRLECTWDRARMPAGLESAYVLWADGTNDEMCFATMAVREVGMNTATVVVPDAVPDVIAECLRAMGISPAAPPAREDIEGIVSGIFECADGEDIAAEMVAWLDSNLGGFLSVTGAECLARTLSTPEGLAEVFVYQLPDSTEAERLPVAELVADCVPLSGLLVEVGLPVAPVGRECIDEIGRPILLNATLVQQQPNPQQLLEAIAPCI